MRYGTFLLVSLCLAAIGSPAAYAVSYSSTVLADNPLVYLPFDEAAGGTANNLGSLGAAGNGAYVNAVLNQSPATSQLGRSVGFNGNAAVRITDNAAFDVGAGPFSVEMWFATTSDARGDLFTYKGGGGDYGLHSNSQGDPAGFNSSVSTFFNGFNGQVGADNNQWHHLVATRGAAGVYRMYIDGVEGSTGVDNDTWNIANDILVGSNHSGDPGNLAIQFTGFIDEVAIYNSELSVGAVANHFNAGLGETTSIGVNFVGGGGSLNSLQVAGVVPQANWNNAAGSDGTVLNLRGDNGAITTVDVSYDGDGTFNSGAGSATPDHILMSGYIDDFDNSTSTYTFSEIPFAKYSVILYTDSDSTDGRDESFTLMSSVGQVLGPIFVSDEMQFNGTFVQATATSLNGAGAQGNFVLFDGVRGDSFTITGQSLNFRNFVAGIQIVAAPPVPEPATTLLVGLGSLLLAVRRRRAA